MLTRGTRGRVGTAVVALACAVAWAGAVEAQTAIGVGNPGPVVPQNGLMGTYYSFPSGSPTPPGNPPGSPDTTPATQANAVQFLQRIDPSLTINYVGNAPPGNANGSDWFMVVWEGRLIVPTTGAYTFYALSDDGERTWIGNVTNATPTMEFWVQRGVPGTPDTTPVQNLTAGNVDVRFEWEQGNGGASMQVQWSGPAPAPATRADIPTASWLPPPGPNAPGSFTVTSSPNNPSPQVDVSWAASTTPVAATSYILSRATAVGGPYTQIAVQVGTTFTDTTVAFGTQYFYVVQATAANGLRVGPATAPQSATPIQAGLTYSPTSGLLTSEGGLNATITLTVRVSPTSNVTFQMASSDATEANLSGGGQPQGSPINLTIPMGTAVGTQIVITVHGLDDFLADGNQNFNITFANFAGGGPSYAVPMGPISGTNQDNDTPNIIVTGISGNTTESGGQATFSVTFTTQPSATTTMAVSSSDTGEGTVNPPTLSFTTANWNTPHVVTVTGVDDTLLDFGQFFTVSLTVNAGGDATYFNMTAPPNGPRTVTVLNVDNETVPTLPPVWGQGGCGLSGAEILLPLGLLALWRRRRHA